MLAILFALVAFVGWATADIFGGLIAKKIGSYSSALWSHILSILISSLYIPFAFHELKHITPEAIIWLLILVPIGMIPLITLYEGIKVGSASLVGTIAGAFGGLVVLLSVIFLGERLNNFQIFSILIIFGGLILSTFNIQSFNVGQILSDKGIPYALISFILWGIYFTFIKIPIKSIGWFWPTYFSYWGFPLVFILMSVKKIKFQFPQNKKQWICMSANSLLLTAALFSFNFALTKGMTAVVAPIATSYPALFAILAYFIFKDRLSRQQILGIVVTLIGIILLSLVS